MTALQIYVSFPGTAREALGFYSDVFGGELACSRTRSSTAATARRTPLPTDS